MKNKSISFVIPEIIPCHSRALIVMPAIILCHSRALIVIPAIILCHSREGGNPDLDSRLRGNDRLIRGMTEN